MVASPFESGLRLMEAQQQLAARSLLNLIEMISTTSTRLASETSALSQDALRLMNAAAQARDPAALADIQKEWADTCLKYGQNQTQASIAFLQQCGLQAINAAARGKGAAKEQP